MRRLGFQERAAEVIEEGWWAGAFMNPEPRLGRNAKRKITSRWMRVIPQATKRCAIAEKSRNGLATDGLQRSLPGEGLGMEWDVEVVRVVRTFLAEIGRARRAKTPGVGLGARQGDRRAVHGSGDARWGRGTHGQAWRDGWM